MAPAFLLLKVMKILLIGIGGGLCAAAASQAAYDAFVFSNVNWNIQFPYPAGPPLGATLLLGIGMLIAGVFVALVLKTHVPPPHQSA